MNSQAVETNRNGFKTEQLRDQSGSFHHDSGPLYGSYSEGKIIRMYPSCPHIRKDPFSYDSPHNI